MSGRLEGKVALVTGATRGIGHAIATRLAEEGALVIGTGRDVDAGRVLEAELQAVGQGEFRTQDVTSEDAWQQLVQDVCDRHGGIDVLVNNAGHFLFKPLLDTQPDELDALFQINVEAAFLGMKLVMRAMAGRGGSIVNISSVFGVRGMAGATAHCATKGAITQMSLSAALDGAKEKIRVNVVHPGVTATEAVTAHMENDAFREDIVSAIPMGRPANPGEIANAVLYLASDEARLVTGSEMTLDGGRAARG